MNSVSSSERLFKIGILGATGFIGSAYRAEIRLATPGQPVRIAHRVDGCEFGNRFQKHVFPALTPILQGRAAPADHPDLEDGWIAQKFTDAASVSIREGRWVKV